MPVTTEIASPATELEFDDTAVLQCFTSHSKNIQDQLVVRRVMSCLVVVQNVVVTVRNVAETQGCHGSPRQGCWVGRYV